MNRKIKDALTLGIAAAFVLMFALWGICKSDDAVSESERRPLKQFPTLNAEEVLSGRFQSNFESYTLDQFPLRDGFRRLKAAVLLDMLREKDNNGIYLADGYAAKLEANGLYTMGDIARCSIGQPTDYHNEELLYKLFGVNAELLIDHAWGWEPCTIAAIKDYRPKSSSLSSGQVLPEPYPHEKARLIVREMADQLSLELVEKGLVCSQFVLDIGYDAENLSAPAQQRSYHGLTKTDRYGRAVPAAAHGSANLSVPASSARILMQTAAEVFDRIVDFGLSVRRVTVTAAGLLRQEEAQLVGGDQLDFFGNYAAHQQQKAELERELSGQQAIVALRRKYGKYVVLGGMDLQEGATTKGRNGQIGGHKA